MTEIEMQEGSKYIYGLLGCDYYENLSTGAECYLEKVKKNNNTALEHDFLQDLAELDTSICYLYGSKQPINLSAKKWLEMINNGDLLEYNPIATTLMEVIYHKMYGDAYNANHYHPVRFYCEFGIIPQLQEFEQIKGEEVGGWCNAGDNPQQVMESYKRHLKGIIHPSRQETKQLLEENMNSEQMTIFDLMKGN